MLKKKRNVHQIHRLQIIGLLEAIFNTVLKIYFVCKMRTNSELMDPIEEQWGGLPGRTSADPAMRKMLLFEYGRLVYVTIALFANNAVVCFDQIVPNISTHVA